MSEALNKAKELAPDAEQKVETHEGALSVAGDKVVVVSHDGEVQEVSRSDVDGVQYTAPTFGDLGRLEVRGKGDKVLVVANVPHSKATALVRALRSVEEDAAPKTAAARETREDKRAVETPEKLAK